MDVAAKIHLWIGTVLRFFGRPNDSVIADDIALRLLAVVIEITPRHELAWYNLGIMLGHLGIGDEDEIAAAHREQFDVNPNHPFASDQRTCVRCHATNPTNCCTKCRAPYCSTACQMAEWPEPHRAAC